jgi:hypothetical protein
MVALTTEDLRRKRYEENLKDSIQSAVKVSATEG